MKENLSSNGVALEVTFLDGSVEPMLFGSIRAIFEMFGAEALGVTEYKLYLFKLAVDHPFQNEKCKITKRPVFSLKRKNVTLQNV